MRSIDVSYESGSVTACGWKGVDVCWGACGEVAVRRGVQQSSTFQPWQSGGSQLWHKQGSALDTAKTTRHLYLDVLGPVEVAVAISNGVTGTTATAPEQWIRRSQRESEVNNMKKVHNGNVVHWY